MSDNNFPCGKCGGSGERVACGRKNCEGCMAPQDCEQAGIYKLCPSCNKGRVQLAVEERSNGQVYLDSLWDGARLTWYRYRPLTNDEVRELINSKMLNVDLVEFIQRCGLKFKGSKVILVPTTN